MPLKQELVNKETANKNGLAELTMLMCSMCKTNLLKPVDNLENKKWLFFNLYIKVWSSVFLNFDEVCFMRIYKCIVRYTYCTNNFVYWANVNL